MLPLKATLLDDDAFRLLAIPFGGPIPSPHSPRGVDLDGEWFDERTDITGKGEYPLTLPRDVDWHHGHDGTLGRTVIGKAVDPTMDDEGWWVTVWLKHGERRLRLIKELAEHGAQLFGSSESVPGKVRKADHGHIVVWPYFRQTLSTSPQNTLSVARPMKAALATPLHQSLRDLGADLRSTYLDHRGGESAATARRVRDDLQAVIRRMETLR
jgi:hypothetical protein